MEEKRATYSEIKISTVPKAQPRKSIFCQFNLLKCAQKKKEVDLSDLKPSDTYLNLISDMENCIDNLSCTSNLSVLSCFPEDYNTLVYETFMHKLQLYYKSSNEKRLKLKVDSYHSFFNMDIVIEKQKSEIKQQDHQIRLIEEYKDTILCIICVERQRNIVFFPCKHLIYCEQCFANSNKDKCPTCKEDIHENWNIDN
jgi:hypothetical protein